MDRYKPVTYRCDICKEERSIRLSASDQEELETFYKTSYPGIPLKYVDQHNNHAMLVAIDERFDIRMAYTAHIETGAPSTGTVIVNGQIYEKHGPFVAKPRPSAEARKSMGQRVLRTLGFSPENDDTTVPK